ncbi:MAG: hypothetical protein KAH35_07205 [Candidatus Atribacteria bacterium]|nr:hypothetical protein [Candidatus Atribacteria bacterium]
MINKILKDVKKTELSAEKIIKDAEKNAHQIIENAAVKVEELKEKMKVEALREGEILIISDENKAREESKNIIKNCEKEKKLLNEKALDKIENTIKLVTEKILEGK